MLFAIIAGPVITGAGGGGVGGAIDDITAAATPVWPPLGTGTYFPPSFARITINIPVTGSINVVGSSSLVSLLSCAF